MSSDMVYQWTTGSRFSVDAQSVGSRCDELRRANAGVLTPEIILADARHKESPMHTLIEWDDQKAAQTYRIEVARRIIRSIVVFADERLQHPVRAFVSVFVEPDAKRREYVAVTEALERPDLRKQVLQNALGEIKVWRRRYAQYNELAKLLDVIDQFDVLDTVSEVVSK